MAELLAFPLVVTMAVKLPTPTGLVVNETVREVAVAESTVPTAPLLNTTVLFEFVVLNPNPRMTIEPELAPSDSVLNVTAGITFATCVDTLARALVVTVAFNAPTVDVLVVNVTDNVVAVEEVTVPTAPLVNETVFSEAFVLKPNPLIVSVVVFAANAAVLLVITGISVAT